MEIEQLKHFIYRVLPEDSISSICAKFNTGKDNILRNNSAIDLYAGEFVEITTNDYITHIVKPTENISEIAKLYNLKEEDIITQNNLDSNKLYIGQILKIKT